MAAGAVFRLCVSGRACSLLRRADDHALDRGAHGWTAPLHPGRSWLSGHIGIRDHGIARLTIASCYDVRAASVCAACLICHLRGAILLRPAPARPPGRSEE